MTVHAKRQQIIEYVAPDVSFFKAKFALVFGTRHGVPRFAEEILALYGQGYFTNLIVSGGPTGRRVEPEAVVLSRLLLSYGIPGEALVIEDQAMNTGENVIFSREKVRHEDIFELFLIGKISSKRRYIMTVRKQWPEVKRICCHGVNYFSMATQEWWKDQEFRTRAINEYRKIPRYLEKGFISEVSIINGVVR
jgi:uncharacterized SAM-binding protein YcdF (DUF218 family)